MKHISTFISTLLAILLLRGLPALAEGPAFTADVIIDTANSSDLHLRDTVVAGTDWEICTGFNSCDYEASPVAESFNINFRNGGSAATDRRPFTIETGSPNNLLYLDSAGRIGIETNAPTHDLHVNGGQVRLQSGTAGNWVLNPGATGLFFRNEDGSTTIPVQFHNNSPSNSFVIETSGEIGIGTPTPTKKLHVSGSDSATLGSTTITTRIENLTGTTGSRHMLQLVNNGDPVFWFHNTANDARWSMNPIGNGFNWSKGGTGQFEMQLQGDGDLIIAGSLTQNSDRNMKEQIHAVDPNEILHKVTELPISSWQNKHDEQKNRHMGPMAQDFYAAFGLGRNEKGIAPGDMSGVALAAIKGLYTQGKEKDAKIAQLEEQLKIQQEQIEKLSALEHVVASLVQQLNAQGPMQVSFETTTPVGNHSF